jgi:hypothetical protein
MYDETRQNNMDTKNTERKKGGNKSGMEKKYIKLTTWENKNSTKPEQLV